MQKILRKAGKASDGRPLYEEVRVFKRLPKGWKVDDGARTAPSGYKWINNGESFFSKNKDGKYIKNPKRKTAFLESDWHSKMTDNEKNLWHGHSPLIIINSTKKKTSKSDKN